MFSYMSNFYKVVGGPKTKELHREDQIKYLPIAYLRGANLDNCITIIDELQNISIQNLITILTRFGTNTKMILLGDSNQIDLKVKANSSLLWAVNNLSNLDGVKVLKFTESEIVRSKTAKLLQERFESLRKENKL